MNQVAIENNITVSQLIKDNTKKIVSIIEVAHWKRETMVEDTIDKIVTD